ncbi:MAG: ABC transporter ATP-binding protein, partial [Planctomycetia bacterium]|nr:ABC transporter ATP-binding protein [Planctomycetia bacterium]
GCGKTTLLRMLAGFVTPDDGDIYFDAQSMTAVPPRARDAGMVFQTYALWPHMTVAENVAYGLKVRNVARAETARRVDNALKLVRLEGFAERRPNQLSGGQQQRVALARALVIEPRVLLLDEPLSNLDARLRDEMRDEIRRLHQATKLTMIYVTHDQKEALTLADRLVVMNAGQVAQLGTPREVYDRPVNRFVAEFLGDSNFVSGTVREGDTQRCVVETPLGPLTGVPTGEQPAVGSRVVCAFRPPALSLHGAEGPNRFQAVVREITFLGDLLQVSLMAGEQSVRMLSLPQQASHLQVGETVSLAVPADHLIVLTR